MTFKIKSKFWIVDDQGRPVLGSGKRLILQTIDETGSIKAAAEHLKMSYRAAWGKIKVTEERLGFKLVETSVGGGKNRGARLTEEARQLLKMFKELQEEGNRQADILFQRVFNFPKK